MTSLPVRSAFGGHVIGSMATARRRRWISGSVSPVYTIRYGNPGSTHSAAPAAPPGASRLAQARPSSSRSRRGVRGVEYRRPDETRRREVPIGPLDRRQRAGRQAAVVEVERVAGRHLEDGAVHRLGPGGQVGVEARARRGCALSSSERALVVTVRPSRPTWYSISRSSEKG